MRAIVASAVFITTLAMNVAAQTPTPPPIATLIAAENEFAAHAVATDMRQAFLRALGKEGVLLRPHPVNGGAFMQAQPVPPIVLNWRPVFATISASGDVGLTTGPWQIVPRGAASRPPAFGQFVSLWKRYSDGQWRLLFDTGIGHPLPSLSDTYLNVTLPGDHRADKRVIDDTLARFAAHAAEHDYLSAVRAFAATSIRVYRDQSAPYLARELLPQKSGEQRRVTLAAMPEVSGQSSSADLIWQLFALRDSALPGARVVAYAFTVWQATADGGIALILDIVNDVPMPKK